ncbi:Phage virion morphogenesis family protein [Aquimixticola soesokkakensis]|uniref:Phage virion morphogenesis family protein n=1 Tax=Aquimixticola soesokkakensis TaxID=1519096 RepID=A0A1Y5SFX3_9RHOB|nr:phage virion morphogenesis protein [Aquimixticola soesokkakensis]SLN38149.1 Phage virion morphogenesis family protein [Aquimixticola soesokkakensis]
MTGISIKTQLRDAQAREGLRDLLARMDQARPFYSAVGDLLVGSAGENFRTETDPEGRPWTPHRPSTIKARTRKGQVPLTILRSNSKGMSGSSLAGSVNYVAGEDEVRVGSAKKTAAIHQLGGTIKRPARAGKIYRMKGEDGQVGRRFVKKSKANHVTDVAIPAYTITIPARPFIGVSASDQVDILEMAEDWLSR